jgi:hypothetical protein
MDSIQVVGSRRPQLFDIPSEVLSRVIVVSCDDGTSTSSSGMTSSGASLRQSSRYLRILHDQTCQRLSIKLSDGLQRPIHLFSGFTGLTHLDLRTSSFTVFRLPELAACRLLTELVFTSPDVKSLDVSSLLGCPYLDTLRLSGCSSLLDLPTLGLLTQIKCLHLCSCDSLSDLSSLAGCGGLRGLSLSSEYGAVFARHLDSLFCFPGLESLELSGFCHGYSFDKWPVYPSLTSLSILVSRDVDWGLTHVSSAFINVSRLLLRGVRGLANLSSVVQSRLSELYLLGSEGLTSVHALAGCSGLCFLNISPCEGLTDIGALSSCTLLSYLSLGVCEVADVSPLSVCVLLVDLSFYSTCEIDPRALASCLRLREVILFPSALLYDISCLAVCTDLVSLSVRGVSVPFHRHWFSGCRFLSCLIYDGVVF